MSNCGTENRDRHRGTLDVPAGPAGAPWRVPGGLTGLGALPQHEVERVAFCLVDLDARTGTQVRELLPGQPAVIRESGHRVIDVAVRDGIGETARHQPLDHGDDLGNVGGRARLVIRLLHAECVEIRVHRGDEPRSQRIVGLAALARAIEDLVVDVRDVPDVGHAIAGCAEPAPRDVECDLRPGMADVDMVVDRHAADVHAHMAGLERRERFLPAGQRVVDPKHALRLHASAMRPPAGRARAPPASRPGGPRARGRHGGPSMRNGAACRAPRPCGRFAT